MQTIKEALSLPEGTAISEIQGLVSKVFPITKKANWSVQNCVFADAAGNELKLKVWNHPDITTLEGKELNLHASKPGDLKIDKPDDYKGKVSVVIAVQKSAQFHTIAVAQQMGHAQQTPANAPKPASGEVSQPKANYVSDKPDWAAIDAKKAKGARLGMCFKLAGDYVLGQGENIAPDDFVAAVKELAGKLEQAAKELEG